jgi:hypothetical protein
MPSPIAALGIGVAGSMVAALWKPYLPLISAENVHSKARTDILQADSLASLVNIQYNGHVFGPACAIANDL